MKLSNSGSTHNYVALFALLSLSACGWVDSTGNQSGAAPTLIDPSLVVLQEGGSFSINENTQRTVAFSSADSLLTDWSWTLLDGHAKIRNCAQFDNFDLPIASNSLVHTCASDSLCEIKLEEQIVDNITRFNVTTPQMRAPAALELQFTARNRIGETVERRQLLCAIPINEAPDAVDDLLTVTRGTYLSVSGDDTKSLLANDNDDEDIRNLSLTVNTTAIEAPSYAKNFQLFSDGGFIYEPQFDAPLSENGSISDKFVYSVSDGSNTSTATVRIKISGINTAPQLTTDLPEIQARITDQDENITLFDFRYYFTDAEFDSLVFRAPQSLLPKSGNIYLTSHGVLKGNPTDSDSGRYFVTISASDSIASTDTSFYLNVVRDSGANNQPYADDIDNRTVRNQFSFDVSGYFGDPDQDHLTFSSGNLPEGVEISQEGVIFGSSSEDNRGNSIIRVYANDGNGGTTSDGFLLRIR